MAKEGVKLQQRGLFLTYRDSKFTAFTLNPCMICVYPPSCYSPSTPLTLFNISHHFLSLSSSLFLSLLLQLLLIISPPMPFFPFSFASLSIFPLRLTLYHLSCNNCSFSLIFRIFSSLFLGLFALHFPEIACLEHCG